jgi:hypothetical protein
VLTCWKLAEGEELGSNLLRDLSYAGTCGSPVNKAISLHLNDNRVAAVYHHPSGLMRATACRSDGPGPSANAIGPRHEPPPADILRGLAVLPSISGYFGSFLRDRDSENLVNLRGSYAMRKISLAVAATMLWPAISVAQVLVQNHMSAPLAPTEYLLPPPLVPAGGCVWANAVYSNGAIVEQVYSTIQRSYLRCADGSWRPYQSYLDAIVAHDDPAVPPRNLGRRPTPLR